MSYDLILKNGHIIDPGNQFDQTADLGIRDNRIVEIGSLNNKEAIETVDVSGCLVTPALIDAHVHLAPLTDFGIPAEITFYPSGVTAGIEAGSAGSANYESLRIHLLNVQPCIKSYLNVSPTGLSTLSSYPEQIDPELFQIKKIHSLFERYPSELIGLKIRMGRETTRDLGLKPLEAAKKLARSLGVGVMVHGSNPSIPFSDLLDLLDRGDVMTHFLHGHGSGLLDPSGAVCEAAWRARKRGVLFDIGDATWHMSHAVARAAIKQGFDLDTMGTDLTLNSLYKRRRAFNLPFVMSKYWNLGWPLKKLVAACTTRPAQLMGIGDTHGKLSVGQKAQVAVLKKINQDVLFYDGNGETFKGNKLLNVLLTIQDGQILYRDSLI
jgi:dihydroorotase